MYVSIRIRRVLNPHEFFHLIYSKKLLLPFNKWEQSEWTWTNSIPSPKGVDGRWWPRFRRRWSGGPISDQICWSEAVSLTSFPSINPRGKKWKTKWKKHGFCHSSRSANPIGMDSVLRDWSGGMIRPSDSRCFAARQIPPTICRNLYSSKNWVKFWWKTSHWLNFLNGKLHNWTRKIGLFHSMTGKNESCDVFFCWKIRNHLLKIF